MGEEDRAMVKGLAGGLNSRSQSQVMEGTEAQRG